MVYDAIVLGLGGMGASACMHLAMRGKRVLGLERFRLAHASGSSHGGSRIVRECYFEHADYVPLLLRCNQLWKELEARTGTRLVHRPGVLYMAHPGGVSVARSVASGAAHGIECHRMDARDVRARFPQFQMPSDWHALFEPGAGFVRPERAVLAHAAVAREHGADLHEDEPVLSWSADARGVAVRTARESYSGGHLVLCAGAWTEELASMLGVSLRVPLRVLRVPMAWLSPTDRPACTAPRMPVWYAEPADDAPVYGVPLAPDQGEPDGVKVARHGGATARECDPHTVDRECTFAERNDLRVAAARFAPCAAGHAHHGAVCLYTMSPDEHFVIDFLPGGGPDRHGRVVVACGFSGHGFKFTPVVGEILADLVCGGKTDHPAQFLAARRFG